MPRVYWLKMALIKTNNYKVGKHVSVYISINQTSRNKQIAQFKNCYMGKNLEHTIQTLYALFLEQNYLPLLERRKSTTTCKQAHSNAVKIHKQNSTTLTFTNTLIIHILYHVRTQNTPIKNRFQQIYQRWEVVNIQC